MQTFLQNLFTKTAIFFVFVACVATSCNPEPPTPTNLPILNRPPKLDEYPKDIAFTEYFPYETTCRWIDMYDWERNDTLIIINSCEELEKYITCSSGSYPVIDFSKNTLLLASGITPLGITEISNRLLQLSANKYKLEIEIELSKADIFQRWKSALIINKLREGSSVELIVTTYKTWE